MEKLKALFLSKKFLTMIAGLLVALAARKGLNLDETEVAGILALFISYILAQGQADKGKEAAKIDAIAMVGANDGVSPSEQAKQVETIKNA